MKRLVIAIVASVAAFLVAFSPRSARACGGGGMSSGSDAALVGFAVVVVGSIAVADATFATYDVVKAAEGEHASKGMAIAEISVTAPQALIFGSAAMDSHGSDAPTLWLLAAIPTAMTLHGIITLASVDWAAERRAREDTVLEAGLPTVGGAYVRFREVASTPKPKPTIARPHDDFTLRLAPTVIPSGVPGNLTLAPAIAAWGQF